MNRTALQNYFSIENFCETIRDMDGDIVKYGIDHLMNETITFAGILHHIEVLGEIAKNLSEDFKGAVPEIKWNDIARTRDIIIHHYHKIDPEIVRKILQEQVPILVTRLPKLREIAIAHLDESDRNDVLKNDFHEIL